MCVHLGLKEFKCDQCQYATSHKSNLQRHAFRLHGIPIPPRRHYRKLSPHGDDLDLSDDNGSEEKVESRESIQEHILMHDDANSNPTDESSGNESDRFNPSPDKNTESSFMQTWKHKYFQEHPKKLWLLTYKQEKVFPEGEMKKGMDYY